MAELLGVVQQACTSVDEASKLLHQLQGILKAGGAQKSTPAKPKAAAKPPAKADSDDSDSDSDEEKPAPKPKAAPKPKPAAKPESDSDSDSDSDDEPPAKPKAAPKPKPAAKPESDSDSDSDSEEEPAPKPKAAPKPKPKPAAKQESDSDSDSDSDVAPAQNGKAKPAAKKAASDSSSSDSDSDAAKPKPAAKPAPAAGEKRKQEESWDASQQKFQKTESGNLEIMVLDIPEALTDDDIWNHYESLGKDAITRMNRPASRQDMCFVTFSAAELAAKALAMDPPSKDGQWSVVKECRPKEGKGKGKGKGKGEGKGKGGDTFDVMIKGCADSITDEVVTEHYKELGESAISRINWVKSKEDGSFKGLGFIKFTSQELANKAVDLGGPWHDGKQTWVSLAADRPAKGEGKGKGKGKGKGGRGPSMKPEGAKVTFDD